MFSLLFTQYKYIKIARLRFQLQARCEGEVEDVKQQRYGSISV